MSEDKIRESLEAGHQALPRLGKNGHGPRVVVCSDIRLLLEGVSVLISRVGSIDVVGQAQPNGAAAMVAALRPHVLLLDGGVAGGRDLLRLLKEVNADLRIVVFALSDGDPDVVDWAEAGASGYVGRDGSVAELTAAVEGALRGEALCSPRLAGLLFARIAELSEKAAPVQSAAVLTRREQEIMELVEQGFPNKEIARRLGIGHATVKNHMHRILEKMRSRGRCEAAARMRRVTATASQCASGPRLPLDPT